VSGLSLAVTREEYDAVRQKRVRRHMDKVGFRTLCHAPFTTLDFSPEGYVTPCNHFWRPLATANAAFSIMELWDGAGLQEIRDHMIDYALDQAACRSCVRQIVAGQHEQAFPVVQFDSRPARSRRPAYPKRLIFRMGNTCNLACVMCDGSTSSRIRSEFERLPPLIPAYGERFFEELEEILPHVEHLEFYGGEPFLVSEHLRVLDLVEKKNPRCSIYVNTNAMSLTGSTKGLLERLNFTAIAISMDAVSKDVHEQVRYGLKSERFYDAVDYLLDLRKRKRGLALTLNVTEHRKNWFELPEVFRFAERRGLDVHINTCIHPENVTLYTLPTEELRYVLEFTVEECARLCEEFAPFKALRSYDFYISLMRAELANRDPHWKGGDVPASALTDGKLGVPIPGLAPLSTPARVMTEIDRTGVLGSAARARFLEEMERHLRALAGADGWSQALERVEQERVRLDLRAPVATLG
jgi:sulfatase maturation enzyme AslB (radical SAM superfamily)